MARDGRLQVVAVALAIVALSGCLSESAGNSPANGNSAGEGQLPTPALVTLSLDLQGLVPWQVSALVWPVKGATTAVILVHGHSGVKENFFDTLPAHGASFGGRLALTNRTVVALDLPGYGQSDGDPNLVNFEVMSEAVRQTAAALRSGSQGLRAHDRIVAYGLSMGAVVVNLAAAGHDQLDGIIPAGYPVTSPTAEGIACLGNPACPEAAQLYNGEFYIPNIGWDVANATIAGYESDHTANLAGYALWDGPCTAAIELALPVPCESETGAEAVASQVAVPVFTLVGDHDLAWLGTDLATEPGYYPASPGVQTWVIPDAGHFVHNHLHQQLVVSRIADWLTEQGL